MSQRQGVQPKKQLDPLFTPPVGAEDSFEVNTTKVIISPERSGVGVPGITGTQTVDIGGENSFVLETPDSIYIYDQRLRRAPGGQQVVDVVIEVEELVGAIEYEVQIAKV